MVQIKSKNKNTYITLFFFKSSHTFMHIYIYSFTGVKKKKSIQNFC